VNGNSYELITTPVTFTAGQRNLMLPINPYLNSVTVTQIVQVAVASGTGYELGSPSVAQVSIEPLLPQITIEAIEPNAIRADQTPGTFLVSRAGVFDRSVLVRLNIGGTASTSTDYSSVSSFVNLSPYQTTALISIVPKSTANVANNARYVQLTLKPDGTYKAMNPSTDRVFILDQLLTHDVWQSKYFPGNSEAWDAFAKRDTGNLGINNLARYAFGLNPSNPVPTNGLPRYQLIDGHLSVTFRHPRGVTDYDYIPQVSDDLIHWSSLTSDVEPFTPVNAGTNDLESVSFRGKAPVNGTPKQFMRVVLEPH
jgi:hypothetical protein